MVRKKLKLSPDVPLLLSQLRGDKTIELEDGVWRSYFSFSFFSSLTEFS